MDESGAPDHCRAQMRNRLHSLCPYFAMFPESFAEDRIARWSKPGDLVLDPFSGRGTTPLQALLMDRAAAAIDINPVAYCVTAAKCDPPSLLEIQKRVSALRVDTAALSADDLREERRGLPPFFGRAFHWTTLDQLLALRRLGHWREDRVDRFVVALALGILHGEMTRSTRYLSNQMPRTISTKPEYSLRYWRKRGLWPLKKDLWGLLAAEAALRLSGPLPSATAKVALGDARNAQALLTAARGRASLVVTSPPYFDVTRFEEDQWLRLWLLGYPPRPTYEFADDRHTERVRYWRFLRACWLGVQPLLAQQAVIVVRIGSGKLPDDELTEGLTNSLRLPRRELELLEGPTRSTIRRRQTSAFRPGAAGVSHEVDYVYSTVSIASVRTR
jgi:hypothetical protein